MTKSYVLIVIPEVVVEELDRFKTELTEREAEEPAPYRLTPGDCYSSFIN